MSVDISNDESLKSIKEAIDNLSSKRDEKKIKYLTKRLDIVLDMMKDMPDSIDSIELYFTTVEGYEYNLCISSLTRSGDWAFFDNNTDRISIVEVADLLLINKITFKKFARLLADELNSGCKSW